MRMLACALIVVNLVLFSCSTSAFGASLKYCNHPTASDYQRLPREYPAFNKALHHFWGAHWREAAIVSFGEGSWSPWAHNGQYLGTFQMGSAERARYGQGSSLWAQAKAAFAYYDSDHSWSHWDCVSY